MIPTPRYLQHHRRCAWTSPFYPQNAHSTHSSTALCKPDSCRTAVRTPQLRTRTFEEALLTNYQRKPQGASLLGTTRCRLQRVPADYVLWTTLVTSLLSTHHRCQDRRDHQPGRGTTARAGHTAASSYDHHHRLPQPDECYFVGYEDGAIPMEAGWDGGRETTSPIESSTFFDVYATKLAKSENDTTTTINDDSDVDLDNMAYGESPAAQLTRQQAKALEKELPVSHIMTMPENNIHEFVKAAVKLTAGTDGIAYALYHQQKLSESRGTLSSGSASSLGQGKGEATPEGNSSDGSTWTPRPRHQVPVEECCHTHSHLRDVAPGDLYQRTPRHGLQDRR